MIIGQRYGSSKQQWFYNPNTKKLVPLQVKLPIVEQSQTQFQQRMTGIDYHIELKDYKIEI